MTGKEKRSFLGNVLRVCRPIANGKDKQPQVDGF